MIGGLAGLAGMGHKDAPWSRTAAAASRCAAPEQTGTEDQADEQQAPNDKVVSTR